METMKLNNGVEMPILGFGTFLINGVECAKSVETAIKTGYRLIDTAQGYGNEEFVGQGIKNSGIDRKELFITTILWFRNYETQDCKKSLDDSFRKLGVDYLDLVILHWPFGNTYSGYRVLEEYYEQRKIRAIGVSNYMPSQLVDLINFNKVVPAVNQVETNLLCQQKELHELMKKYNVALQAYSPLGQGKANEMFENPIIVEIAKKYNKTPRQVALRFLTQCDVGVIPKTTNADRMKENLNIFDFELTNDEIEKLKTMDTNTPLIGSSQNYKIAEMCVNWG